ncbi:MAG: ATP-binding protein [Cyanobacteria bacterium J06597_16]
MVVSDFVVKTKAAIAQLTDPSLLTGTVDISNCDREPIHIPAAIQPHGVMLVLHNTDGGWQIVHVSQNTSEHLGRSPQSLLNQPLSHLLTAEQLGTVESCLQENFETVNPLQFEIEVHDESKPFSGIIHRSQKAIIIELEPTAEQENISFFDFHSLVKRPVSRLQQSNTLSELCTIAVQEIQQITGYDRVMVYAFDEDDSGQVIAEVKQPEMEAYLGLHYPASDIPKQAKHLYVLNRLRLIPDVTYGPVPLVSASKEAHGPIDMSLSTLRSVSPLHTEYLSNMGVRATLAISLVRNNRLWGLLVCHHNGPRQLSYELRTVCEFLGQVVALELSNKTDSEDADYRLRIKTLQTQFVEALPQHESLQAGLMHNPENLLALTGATGVAFCEKGDIALQGKTPTQADVRGLLAWLSDQFDGQSLYQTEKLSEVYPPAEKFAGRTSGLLALSVSEAQQVFVLWFREEVLQTVNWAGNPEKPMLVGDDGELRMSPRQSFAKWEQTVKGRSRRWLPCEIEAAIELRRSIINLVLQKADELAQLNSELTRSNIELDSFAYIASHDLKEPLRGIHNYSSFLIEDYGQTLGKDGVEKLNTLMSLTQRMENLISSLLYYSRLGRAELQLETVDFGEVVGDVINVINMSKPENVVFKLTGALPVMMCDRIQITELLTNLITNAIKYNNKATKQITVGVISPAEASQKNNRTETVFYVQDNGIGIKPKHLETVFRIFKRLHPPKRYGGGTGAGLTIAKKIVERHGGQLWIESVYEEGSTFYFTLNPEEADPLDSPSE